MSIALPKKRNRRLVAVPAVLIAGAVWAATGHERHSLRSSNPAVADTIRKDTYKIYRV